MNPRLAQGLRLLRRNWFAVLVGAGVVGAIGVGYLVGEKRFSDDRTKVLAEIDTFTGVLTRARSNRESRPALDARLQAITDRTLGGSIESVDSEVRRRLNRACEELGLSEFSVTTGVSNSRPTPAKSEFKRPDERKLRDEPDFVELQTTVTASGTASQVLQLVFRMEIEPWLKRIELIRLNPDVAGDKVRVTLRANTIFLPGQSPKSPLVLDQAKVSTASRYAALFGANLFKVPAPPPATPAVVASAANAQTPATPPPSNPGTDSGSAPAGPTGFAYGEWQVTGIVEGPTGTEVWLRHVPSGTPLTLAPGGAVGDLILRSVRYDFAVFEGAGGSFRVQVGNNLSQRVDAGG